MILKLKGLILFLVTIFLLQSCGEESSSMDTENNGDQIEDENNTHSYSEDNEDDIKNEELFNFKSDNDVLTYLIGKRFESRNSDIYMKFETYGAEVSGLKYQWLNHQAISKNKAVIKLASTETINPDGVITIWVDCHLNTVTDGETVLMFN